MSCVMIDSEPVWAGLAATPPLLLDRLLECRCAIATAFPDPQDMRA